MGGCSWPTAVLDLDVFRPHHERLASHARIPEAARLVVLHEFRFPPIVRCHVVEVFQANSHAGAQSWGRDIVVFNRRRPRRRRRRV